MPDIVISGSVQNRELGRALSANVGIPARGTARIPAMPAGILPNMHRKRR
ncbi:hypothetical protein [Hyphomicrobium sp.]|jgi:hypothetical protein